MSFLGRLFRGAPPPPPPPANRVVISDDLAARLTQTGIDLEAATNEAVRAYFKVLDEPKTDLSGMPFWLEREKANSEMEDELRDRVTQRRAVAELPFEETK
jgi:hypothetical protein